MDSAVQVHALRRFCSRPNGPNSAQPSRWDGLIGDEYSFCEDSSGESSAKNEDFEFVVFYQQKVAAQKLKSNWLFIRLPCQFAQFESRVSLLPCKNFFFFSQDQDLQLLLGPRTCAVSSTQLVAGAVMYTLQNWGSFWDLSRNATFSPLRLSPQGKCPALSTTNTESSCPNGYSTRTGKTCMSPSGSMQVCAFQHFCAISVKETCMYIYTDFIYFLWIYCIFVT